MKKREPGRNRERKEERIVSPRTGTQPSMVNLGSIPGTYTVEGEGRLLQVVLRLPFP